MQDILTITLNPAIDLATSVDQVVAGPKLRCDAPQIDPGGGGINVSRSIAILGGASRAFVALGGAAGQQLHDLLTEEGIDVVAFAGPGDTRQNLAVTDRGTGGQYRFVMPGADWDDARCAAVLTAISQASPKGGFVVFSGSLSPGVPADFPARLCAALEERGARLVVDTSGAALRQMAQPNGHCPHVLRMDGAEAEDLAGRPLPTRADSAAFAAGLVDAGCAHMVVVARGADGSALATSDARLHACAADVPIQSKVGAGDSFVGGFTLALAQGRAPGDALQRGAAAASAAVMTPATRLCTRADAERLIAECPLSDLTERQDDQS